MSQKKNSFIIIFCLIGFFCESSCLAFQNFFNVPNSVITPDQEIYFQQQINTNNLLSFSTDLVYGLGKNWELAFAAYDLQTVSPWVNPQSTSLSDFPVFMVGAQKGIYLGECFLITFGFKSGIRTGMHLGGQFANKGLIHLSKDFPDLNDLKIVVGGYYANAGYLESNSANINFEAGIQLNLVPKRMEAVIDLIIGENTLGMMVFGGTYWLNNQINVSLGYGIPWPKSNNSNTLVFELTIPRLNFIGG